MAGAHDGGAGSACELTCGRDTTDEREGYLLRPNFESGCSANDGPDKQMYKSLSKGPPAGNRFWFALIRSERVSQAEKVDVGHAAPGSQTTRCT